MEEEMRRLEEELRSKSSDLMKAATIGQALVEENAALQDKLDGVIKDCNGKTEALQQEIYSLQLRLERSAKMEDWYKDEISQLKQDLVAQRDSAQTRLDVARQQETAPLKTKVENLQADLEVALQEGGQLRETVAQLEELMQERLNQTQPASRTQDLSEMEALQEENLALTNDLTALKARMIERESELKKAKQEVESGRARADSRGREIEELQCQVTSYANALEKSRMEMLELRAQMEALRLETGDHKHKGNSLFSELEDRRVRAEKKLISLQSQLEASHQKVEMERQQNQKLRMRLMMALQMGGGGADKEVVEKLRFQLSEARAEVTHLLEQKSQQEKEEALLTDRLSTLTAGQSDTDKNYTQFLIATISRKEKEVEELRCQLNGMQLQLLDRGRMELEQDRRIQELQAERKKFHAQAVKLSLKNEELLLKYDPDQVKNRQKVLRGITEKIPLEETKDSSLNFSLPQFPDSRPSSSVSKPPPPPTLPSKCEGIPGLDQSYLPFSVDEDRDSSTTPSTARVGKPRGVAMSENVEVRFEDGHMETTTLADSSTKEGVKVAKENSGTRPKGRVIRNVKDVSNVPVHECKTQ